MKTKIILIAAFLLLTVGTFGQWIPFNSLADSADYKSISFYGDFTGFATRAYPYSKLLKTINGGLTWFEVDIPGQLNHVNYVEMTDEKTVWLVMNQDNIISTGGNISKSVDCGQTWEVKFSASCIRKLFILDERHLWAGDGNRRVYYSTDGGETWTMSDQLEMSIINDMYFINSDTGWAAGGSYNDVIEKTTDGGQTWEVQFMRNNSQGGRLYIDFLDSNRGFCAGKNRLMLKTIDGGETWEYVSGGELGNLGILEGLPETNMTLDMEFINEKEGWIVGGDGQCPALPGHFIMSTIDAGESWQMDMLDEYLPKFQVNQVVFNDDNKGWCVGDNGLLFFMDLSVDVKDVPVNSTLKVFPNPVHHTVIIRSDKEIETIRVYNQYGQLLYQEKAVNLKETQLDLSAYPSGVYIIRIGEAFQKVVKA